MKKQANADNQPVLSGTWSDNVRWEFILDESAPDPSLCTSVYCLAIMHETDKVVMTRIDRGWEMLGGHIEPGESLDQALMREALEEGGFHPDVFVQFGYRKVIHKQQEANRHGGHYPMVAYIPHFVAVTRRNLVKPSGHEIIECGEFARDQIENLKSEHTDIIKLGLTYFDAHRNDLIGQLD